MSACHAKDKIIMGILTILGSLLFIQQGLGIDFSSVWYCLAIIPLIQTFISEAAKDRL